MKSPAVAFQCMDTAIEALASRLRAVDVEPCVGTCCGRVLAEDAIADRDCPAADVSAMDGYAVRLSDIQSSSTLPVAEESRPGAPPPKLTAGTAVRIFTGAVVPAGADAVIKREDTVENSDSIELTSNACRVSQGENIRFAGENARAGSAVLTRGSRLHAATRASLANFGFLSVDVFAPVRIAIITTGDELGMYNDKTPQVWQLRNSNMVSLASMFQARPWVIVQHVDQCPDDLQLLSELIESRLTDCDAILLTGGVSAGAYDHVPQAVTNAGCEIVFHGLPIRPGKPILGACSSDGRLVLGLPGNPVSAVVGCRRIALPLIAKMSGQANWLPKVPAVQLVDFGKKTLPLFWLRLVRLTDHGVAEIVESKGSGDLVSLGKSDGFIQCTPSANHDGPWPYYAWA